MKPIPPSKRLLLGGGAFSQPPPPPSAPSAPTVAVEVESELAVESEVAVDVDVEAAPPSAPQTLPPDDLEPDADAMVLHWGATLDAVDYFTLLHLPTPAADAAPPGEVEVRRAFHSFALAFHPDRYRGAPPDVREATNRVFARGAEAYRVLLDPLLARHYARQLADGADGALRASNEEIALSAPRGSGAGESVLVADLVRSAAARPFAARADELIAAGDLRQARLQLQLAILKDPQNARLEERMRALDDDLSLLRASGAGRSSP